MKILILPLVLGFAATASAATIVTNNTGLPNSTFSFIDLESGATGAATVITTTPGDTATITGSMGGSDGDGLAFGNLAVWAANNPANSVLYTFNSLTAGTYNIYATWHGGGTTAAAVAAGGTGGATGNFAINQNVGPSAAGTGFTAWQSGGTPAADAATEVRNFQLLGTVTAATDGTLTLNVGTSSAAGSTHWRSDAFAIAPVPEPSAALLGGLGLLGLLRRRRA